MRFEAAFVKPARKLRHAFGEARRLAPREVAPEHADYGSAFQEREVERQLGNLAGGEADYQVAAAPRDRAEGRLRIRAADRVVDHVRATAPRERADALAQIFGGVVDRLVGAVIAAYGELLIG